GRGPTPPAELRQGHPAQRRAVAAAERAAGARRRSATDAAELLVGRNPVAEALRADVPATALYVVVGIEVDDRVAEAVRRAGGRAVLGWTRRGRARRTNGVLHQGIALQVPPFGYADPLELLDESSQWPDPPLLVALDGVTDPRNLGAVVRSAAAFGSQGVVVPERRAAGMTATAWRTSAGAAARLPVARATNLTRTLT